MRDYDAIIKELQAARAAKVMRLHTQLSDALIRYPDLQQAQSDYNEGCFLSASGKKVDLKTLKDKRDKLLVAHGLSIDNIEPPYDCTLCNDSGYTKDGICECVKRRALDCRENIVLPLHDFDKAKATAGKSELRKAYDIAAQFLDSDKTSFMICGASGTGKTYLACALCHKAVCNARTVTALTAFDFNQRLVKYHTDFTAKKEGYLSPLLECDLLCVDDLGTEPIFKNVTLEYLYLIINERQMRSLKTVITSNLSIKSFYERYGERIGSRLFSAKTSVAINLSGENKRHKQ